jgi:tetratricopeptide (TPR) repeat protein
MALKIESRLTNVQNPADTHINACAVLSQLGRHQTALEHAQQALILLQEELLAPPGTGAPPAPPAADRIAVLAIAYHNIGVEQEFLKRFDQATLSYRKGVEVAERYLGTKHAICITLRNSLVAAKKAATAATKNVRGGKSAAAEPARGGVKKVSADEGPRLGAPAPAARAPGGH